MRITDTAEIVETKSLSDLGEDGLEKMLTDYLKELNSLPGQAKEKYLVVLRADSNSLFYPIINCPAGFTAALKDAMRKHREMGRSRVESARVLSADGKRSFEPPDYIIEMIALGANVVGFNSAA
jgi:hypothetical protein